MKVARTKEQFAEDLVVYIEGYQELEKRLDEFKQAITLQTGIGVDNSDGEITYYDAHGKYPAFIDSWFRDAKTRVDRYNKIMKYLESLPNI